MSILENLKELVGVNVFLDFLEDKELVGIAQSC
jgi:hypothetical protein